MSETINSITGTFTKNTWNLSICIDGITAFPYVRNLSGLEEVSALYKYELQVGFIPDNNVKASCKTAAELLGKRITVHVKVNDSELSAQSKIIRTIHGVIMSVASSTVNLTKNELKTADNKDIVWYLLTIRPEFAKSCYNLKRTVYNADTLKATNKKSGESLIEYITGQWQTPVVISKQAKNRIPEFIQLLQNEESDYNFFTRILSAWGLGYVWDMKGDEEDKDNEKKNRERLLIIDMCSNDRELFIPKQQETKDREKQKEPQLMGMSPVSNYAMHWRVNYGYQSDNNTQLSQRNDSWDQTRDGDSKYTPGDLIKTHDNGLICHGRYVYNEKNKATAGYEALSPGLAAYWQTSPQCDDTQFYQTALTINVDKSGFTAIIEGRSTKAGGLGILPRPVLLNNSPDLSKEELIKGDAHPTPRMSVFMAMVEDETLHPDLTSRNLCKVREITAVAIDGNLTKGDLLWVETGSPFADANSGLLARPRRGNVLLCMDRGDMSIPIVLTSMYRHNNTMPLAALKPHDGKEYVNDYNAVTIRNRSYTKNEGTITHHAVSDINKFTVPQSVHKLGLENPNCSQIQLIGKNNTAEPKVFRSTGSLPSQYEITTRANYVKERGNKGIKTYSDCVSRLAIPETMLSFSTGKNLGNSMIYKAVHTDNAADLTDLKQRDHFQGINISSEKDLLQQSVDSQFINAGGIINLTAAAGITLRVGRNSISITEDGIEITGGFGHVNNPGAHEAYNDDNNAEQLRISSQHSSGLTLNESGTSLSAVNAKLAACSNIRMEVSMGSIIELSNYDAAISAPATSIVGGAAITNTIYFGTQTLIDFACGISSDFGGSETAGKVQSQIDTTMNYIAEGVGFVKEVVDDGMAKWRNLLSVTGSAIDLGPKSMDFSSSTCNLGSGEHHIYVDPISGFNALAKNTLDAMIPHAVAKTISVNKNSKSIIRNTVRSLQNEQEDLKNHGIHLKSDFKIVNQNNQYVIESTSSISQNEKTISNDRSVINDVAQEVNQRQTVAQASGQALSDETANAITQELNSLKDSTNALNNNL